MFLKEESSDIANKFNSKIEFEDCLVKQQRSENCCSLVSSRLGRKQDAEQHGPKRHYR